MQLFILCVLKRRVNAAILHSYFVQFYEVPKHVLYNLLSVCIYRFHFVLDEREKHTLFNIHITRPDISDILDQDLPFKLNYILRCFDTNPNAIRYIQRLSALCKLSSSVWTMPVCWEDLGHKPVHPTDHPQMQRNVHFQMQL